MYTQVCTVAITSEDARVSAGVTASVCRVVNNGRHKACAGGCAKKRSASVLDRAQTFVQTRAHRMFDLLLSVWS